MTFIDGAKIIFQVTGLIVWIALIIGLGFYIYMRLSEKKEHKQAIKEYNEKHKENVQEAVKK